MGTKASYSPPRSDEGNEGTGPHGRKYVADRLLEAEKYAPGLMWACDHCDALNQPDRTECAECGALRREVQ